MYALNDPYAGGTHLPDIYTAQPVFRNGRVIGHVVTIAHHADVGGKTAGGNGCDATELFQEGICLPPVRLMAEGQPVEHVWRLLERNVRVPNQVLGDLRAQLAAGHVGERGLLALAEEHGPRRLADLGAAVLDYAPSGRGWRSGRFRTGSTASRTTWTTTGSIRSRFRSGPRCTSKGTESRSILRGREGRCGGRLTARCRLPSRRRTPACGA